MKQILVKINQIARLNYITIMWKFGCLWYTLTVVARKIFRKIIMDLPTNGFSIWQYSKNYLCTKRVQHSYPDAFVVKNWLQQLRILHKWFKCFQNIKGHMLKLIMPSNWLNWLTCVSLAGHRSPTKDFHF